MARTTIIGGGYAIPVVAKTASYTVKSGDCGKIFTNRGAAGAITITTPKAPRSGFNFRVFGVANQNIVVASDPADKLTVFNDLEADTWSLATAGSIIGSGALVVYDGTSWLVIPAMAGSDLATPVMARATLAT